MFTIKKEKEILEYLNNIYITYKENPVFVEFQSNLQRNLDIFEEKTLFLREQEIILKKKRITPLSENVIFPIVNSLCGIEIQNPFRIKVTLDNAQEDEHQLEKALNKYLYSLQSKPEYEQNFREIFRDSIIRGVGFALVCYDKKEPIIKEIKAENCVFNIKIKNPAKETFFVWEPTTVTDLLETYDYKKIKDLLPTLEEIRTPDPEEAPSDLISDRQEVIVKAYAMTLVPGWKGNNQENGVFTYTTNEKKAKKLSNCVKTLIRQTRTFHIYKGHIIATDTENPVFLEERLPIFSLFYDREKNNKPRGLIDNVWREQLELNYSLSCQKAFITAQNVVINTENKAIMASIKEHPEGILALNNTITLGEKDKITQNNFQVQANMLETTIIQTKERIKKLAGIEDETRGIQTNAISGVAIQERDHNSIRSNSFLFEKFRQFKQEIGRFWVKQLQNSFEKNIVIENLDKKTKDIFVINFAPDNEKIVENDISKRSINVYLEEVPLYNRSSENTRNEILRLLSQPNLEVILQSPYLMSFFVENPEEIIEEIQKYKIQQQQINQNLNIDNKNMV